MLAGYLALVLHAHLPFVHHPDEQHLLEERWLFEALTECYLPLLEILEQLQADQVGYQITISLSPTLIAMLDNALLQDRYLEFLERLIILTDREIERTEMESINLKSLAELYKAKFTKLKESYLHKYHKNLINPFKRLLKAGCIEIITCAATHGYLPLMLTEEATRAQIGAAVHNHIDYFGEAPKGIWLPECGYYPGLDQILQEFGLQYFILDTHGIIQATPTPIDQVYVPVRTHQGVTVFGRDPVSALQVWSSYSGYPGDYDYREYYRDIGWDLPWEYIQKHLDPHDFRHNTGIKYYRITGTEQNKDLYQPSWALEKATIHATHFVESRMEQIINLAQTSQQPPIIVSPYDMELFGHWWYEGPCWLEQVIRKSFTDQNSYQLISPSNYLANYRATNTVDLGLSSWGEGGYSEVWLNPSNDWLYRHLHQAEQRMVELASNLLSPCALQQRALQQAGRELLLAQSSDWAFIIKTGTTVTYAEKRFKSHIANFNDLYEQLKVDCLDEQELVTLEQKNAIFPNLKYQLWQSKADLLARPNHSNSNRKILMLSWEFPPKTIGGLARHVDGLATALANQGVDVHVLTAAYANCPARELIKGVIVHRLETLNQEDQNFFHWILQLNISMLNYAIKLANQEGPFQLIHAHDWLVAYAAEALQLQFKIPLVATIHATEHGRNQGIHNALQHKIHQVESRLIRLAECVIVCSKFMYDEVMTGFPIPNTNVISIPNGIEIASIIPSDNVNKLFPRMDVSEKIILFIGRLVLEKGVQILLEALTLVKAKLPHFKCLIAGRGPLGDYLVAETTRLNLHDQVAFLGYINDQTRNQLLAEADVAVYPSLYEPFGIVALEAMAAGLPLIVADSGGLGELIKHKINGLKVPPGDCKSLAEAILYLFVNPQLQTEMVKRAKQDVMLAYNWEQVAQQTQAVYDQASKKKVGGNIA